MTPDKKTIADLRPGDIGFGPIHGGAGLLVGLGQLALLEGFRVGPLSIRHVFVVTDAFDYRSDGQRQVMAVEAEPGGARIAGVNERWTNEYAYVRLPEDYPGQAGDAAAIARAMIGTPYSFASYGALALWRMGWKTPRLERWIGRTGAKTVYGLKDKSAQLGGQQGGKVILTPCEAICSVLADQAWSLTGKKIMQGVAHQCVTPGALARTLLSYPGAEWIWPGIS